jgi:hypothetical protein
MRSTNIALSEEMWEQANILAIKKRMTFTALVRDALQHYLAGDHVDMITIDSSGNVHPPEACRVLINTRGI